MYQYVNCVIYSPAYILKYLHVFVGQTLKAWVEEIQGCAWN